MIPYGVRQKHQQWLTWHAAPLGRGFSEPGFVLWEVPRWTESVAGSVSLKPGSLTRLKEICVAFQARVFIQPGEAVSTEILQGLR